MIESDPNFEKKKVIVLAKEGWHQGVIGIVASRICEKYYKPCILISHSNGIGKGSGRSTEGLDLFEALSECGDELTMFGGHKVAAGLTINVSELDKFTEKINKYAAEHMSEEDFIPKIKIDCAVSEKAVTLENAELLTKLEPFGTGNEKPVFAMRGAEIVYINAMGSENKHLRMSVRKNGRQLNCIGFFMGAYAQELKTGDIVNLAFQMDINTYQGHRGVQLMLKDIQTT